MSERLRNCPTPLPPCRASAGRGTSPSSWTATAAGRSGRTCRGSRGTAAAWPASAARPRSAPGCGIEQLTLYCLSSENWKRPQPELDFLMHLLEQYMIEERTTIMDNNLRVRMIGRRDGHPRPGAARARQDGRHERRQHAACGSAWRSTTAAGPSWSTPCARSADEIAAGRLDAGRRRRSRRSPSRLYTAGLRRPRPADSHGRRDADQQLSAVADQLRRDLGHRPLLAGVRRADAARGDPRLRQPQPQVRRPEPTKSRG